MISKWVLFVIDHHVHSIVEIAYQSNMEEITVQYLLTLWSDTAVSIGLTSFQMIVVFGMLITGMFVQWQFQHGGHGHHHHHDHDE